MDVHIKHDHRYKYWAHTSDRSADSVSQSYFYYGMPTIRIEFPYNGYFRHRSPSHLMLSWLKWEELKGRQSMNWGVVPMPRTRQRWIMLSCKACKATLTESKNKTMELETIRMRNFPGNHDWITSRAANRRTNLISASQQVMNKDRFAHRGTKERPTGFRE